MTLDDVTIHFLIDVFLVQVGGISTSEKKGVVGANVDPKVYSTTPAG